MAVLEEEVKLGEWSCESGRQDFAVESIDNLDLSQVKAKLCMPVDKGGNGWHRHKSEVIELWYKRFLKLCFLQKKAIVPLGNIDAIWHVHILFTRKYHEDCQRIFGHYLHHRPYGVSDAEASEMQRARQESATLFEEFFGSSPLTEAVDCSCHSSGNCCGNDS